MPKRLNLQKSLLTQSGRDLPKALRKAQYNTQAQASGPSSRGLLSGPNPTGLGEGDQLMRLNPSGLFTASLSDANGNLANVDIPPGLTLDTSNMLPFQTGSVAPTLDNFPTDGNWGWYLDTALSQLYVVRNYQNTLIYPNFVSISGTISDAQHGDRSTTTTTMHKFAQISGVITDTQHGNRAGGTLHPAATTSVAGFMSSTDKTNLDANTADLAAATSAATANTLVRRGAAGAANFAGTLGVVDVDASGHYEVDSIQVVTNQQTAITNALTGGSATAANCATTINLVLAAMRTHGLIAT